MPLPSSSSTVLDSMLFRDAFGTPAMRGIFSDVATVDRYIQVEVALARAQSACGIVPPEAAASIAESARIERIDFDRMRKETDIVGYPILPLVHQLADMCGEAGRYVHWGATTQDIMDTASVLQVRAGLDVVEEDLRHIREVLRALAQKHRQTVMAGRTHLQHALPVTFGYKVAVWLSMFDRHQVRLAQLRERVQVVQLGGAAGTLASLGDAGVAVQHALARELGLGVAPTPWHVARDGLAEAVSLLALITGSLGKVATDIMMMASTEFGEVYEPFVKGRGASSTMPQKRNPISSELMLAAAKAVRQHAGLMVDGMVQDFERATGPWHAEWVALPESFVLTAGALHQARFALEGLIVDEARMRRNLDLSDGLIVAEAVMMALAPKLGRQDAHDAVYDACRRACDDRVGLAQALMASPGIREHFDDAQIAAMTDPVNYLGQAAAFVDRACAASLALDEQGAAA
ncbi:3-carboxy-cis%2Ccis-muconate cycloisomerase [Bordetella ansorpii]|uniref:3-carboxy-cis,cis-muconate cycloisomerase n=1 Tax=Bordetella ansorpii TaxID=288768 RepID=A0A157S622_9BORD|nr:adenylosuccinate lyase family protein [Bordetella ansorpii]SAI65870.1 3-carboxy-cis%2Ccis-muconate cycloisomerase [Bordetella ansorpii]